MISFILFVVCMLFSVLEIVYWKTCKLEPEYKVGVVILFFVLSIGFLALYYHRNCGKGLAHIEGTKLFHMEKCALRVTPEALQVQGVLGNDSIPMHSIESVEVLPSSTYKLGLIANAWSCAPGVVPLDQCQRFLVVDFVEDGVQLRAAFGSPPRMRQYKHAARRLRRQLRKR